MTGQTKGVFKKTIAILTGRISDQVKQLKSLEELKKASRIVSECREAIKNILTGKYEVEG